MALNSVTDIPTERPYQMYPLDFTKCTAADVIQHSWVCHPFLMTERLKDAESRHERNAKESHSTDAARIANDCAKQCRVALTTLQDYPDGEGAMVLKRGPLGPFIQAFHCAAELQLVPRHLRAAIIE